MSIISKLFRKSGLGAATPGRDPAGEEPDAVIIDYAALQFGKVGLLQQANEPKDRALKRLELLFCDCYLSAILRGLSQSVEVRAPELKEKPDLVFRKMIGRLAGDAAVERIVSLSMQGIMAEKSEFLRGLKGGYGEGLTVLGFEKHDPVLPARLQHFADLFQNRSP